MVSKAKIKKNVQEKVKKTAGFTLVTFAFMAN